MHALTTKSIPLSADAIPSVHDDWSGLAVDSIEKNVFLFPWFVESALPLLKDRDPVIVMVSVNEMLIGLAVMQRDRGYARLPITFYRNCNHYHQFLATPLIRTGYAREFFAGMSQWLDASPSSQSFCLFDLLTGEPEITEAAAEVFKSQNRPSALIDEFERAAIYGDVPLSESSERETSKGRLKNLRRRRKQLSKLGTVTVEHFSAEDNAQEWLEDFLRVEDSGWKGDEKTSIAKNEPDLEVYRSMIAAGEAGKGLSFMRLCLDGVAIAYTLDLKSDHFVYCLKCGYDDAYRKYSPGVILEQETLQKYHSSGQKVIVDSCTSPKNQMLNDLWPHRRKIVSLAFARDGYQHQLAFKSVLLLKNMVGRIEPLKRAGK